MSNREFHRLTLTRLAPGTGFAGSLFDTADLVDVAAYALEVMTDLRFVPAASIRPDATIDAALQHMIARGVRMLLVADEAGSMTGLVTARDIDGPRPAAVMAATGVPRQGVTVAAIMTPAENIEVLPLDEVLHAKVGDIVVTLKDSGRQHALVVEEQAASGRQLIRGIFSAAQIARQLGLRGRAGELSQTFADLEAAVAAEAQDH